MRITVKQKQWYALGWKAAPCRIYEKDTITTRWSQSILSPGNMPLFLYNAHKREKININRISVIKTSKIETHEHQHNSWLKRNRAQFHGNGNM